MSEAALVSYSSPSHVVWLMQRRSEVVVAALLCHCVPAVQAVRSAHSRLVVAVGAVVCHWVVASHVATVVHSRLLVVVSSTLSHWSSAHTVCG